MRKFVITTFGIAGLALLPLTSEAGAITGTLNIGGDVRINAAGTIDFGANGGANGIFTVSATSTLKNGVVTINSGTASEKDLDGAVQTVNIPFAPLDLFETLSASPTVNFVLRDIKSCAEIGGGTTCPASLGPDNPFGFSETILGTGVTLLLQGTVFDSTTPLLVSDWIGIFTAQFAGRSIQSLIDQLDDTGFIETSISASKITTAIPEPASLLTFGAGAAMLAALARRRRRSVKA